MNRKVALCLLLLSGLFFYRCGERTSDTNESEKVSERMRHGGYENQIAWGEHLTIIAGCADCHTPKKMTPGGPVFDSSMWFAGRPSAMPRIEVDQRDMASRGLVVTRDLTEWIGPWGVSFAANLTPDDTGIGTWKEEQFIYAIREGKYRGLEGSRTLLPPMPWEMYRHMSDDELKAMYAYLRSLKPVSNNVPEWIPPGRDGAQALPSSGAN